MTFGLLSMLFIFKKRNRQCVSRVFLALLNGIHCGSSRMSSLFLGKEECLLKQRLNFCGQMIIYFSLNTDFGLGARMATSSSGNGCVLLDPPTLWAFVLRQLQMDRAGLLKVELFQGLAQKRRLKKNLFHLQMKMQRDFFFFFWGIECN